MKLLPQADLLSLKNRVAIVTGASAGIGYGIAYRLAEAGAKVVLVAHHEDQLKKALDDLRPTGADLLPIVADVSVEHDVQHMVAKTLEVFGRIDVLVNNAGIFPYAPLQDLTAELFDRVVAVNLRGVFLCTKYVSESMIQKEQGGRIINITSIDALHPSMMGLAHYDATKHGVWGFTKNVAIELARHKIWVNAVAPGGVLTPGAAKMQGGQGADLDRNPDPPPLDVPMGRMGVPDDIAKAVLFLASDMASYMTGTQIVVDGGYLLK